MFWTLTNVNLPRLSLCLQNNKWPHIRNNNKIERFPVTSRQQYSCSKTKKWQPFWCAKTVLWALNSIFMQKSSFVWVNYYQRLVKWMETFSWKTKLHVVLALISYYLLTVCALFIFIQILLQRMMKVKRQFKQMEYAHLEKCIYGIYVT